MALIRQCRSEIPIVFIFCLFVQKPLEKDGVFVLFADGLSS